MGNARAPFTLVVLLPLWGVGWMVTLQPDRLAVDGSLLSCGLTSRACLDWRGRSSPRGPGLSPSSTLTYDIFPFMYLHIYFIVR